MMPFACAPSIRHRYQDVGEAPTGASKLRHEDLEAREGVIGRVAGEKALFQGAVPPQNLPDGQEELDDVIFSKEPIDESAEFSAQRRGRGFEDIGAGRRNDAEYLSTRRENPSDAAECKGGADESRDFPISRFIVGANQFQGVRMNVLRIVVPLVKELEVSPLRKSH